MGVSRGEGSTAGGASSGVVAARSTTSSGAVAAELADGMHPTTVATETTHTMMATTVAATILADQAKEEKGEVCHLTVGEPLFLCCFARW